MDLLSRVEEIYMVAVLELTDNAYGVTIKKQISQKTGKIISYGGLYFALDKLVKKGLLTKTAGEPTAKRGGRTKFYYALTNHGLARWSDQGKPPAVGHIDSIGIGRVDGDKSEVKTYIGDKERPGLQAKANDRPSGAVFTLVKVEFQRGFLSLDAVPEDMIVRHHDPRRDHKTGPPQFSTGDRKRDPEHLLALIPGLEEGKEDRGEGDRSGGVPRAPLSEELQERLLLVVILLVAQVCHHVARTPVGNPVLCHESREVPGVAHPEFL